MSLDKFKQVCKGNSLAFWVSRATNNLKYLPHCLRKEKFLGSGLIGLPDPWMEEDGIPYPAIHLIVLDLFHR